MLLVLNKQEFEDEDEKDGEKNGASDWSRTSDLGLMSPTL